MAGMSRGARVRFDPHEPNSPGLGARIARRSELTALIVVPASAALALLAIATESAHRVDSELRVTAPVQALEGGVVPIRAQLYADLGRPEGARLVHARVDVELRNEHGDAIVSGQLRPSYAHTLDGVLALPPSVTGPLSLRARARLGSRSPRAEREIAVGSVAAPSAFHTRLLPPLQRLSTLPVRVEFGDAIAPDALDVRVAQGACVPEQPCELFVYVGSPAASIRLEGTASVTPDTASARPSPSTSNVVALRVTTHGPEAQLTVLAERAGAVVARRRVRLPVALGASVLVPPPRVLVAPALPSLALRGDERGCIVDAFRELRWLRTGSLRACGGQESLPFPALSPGLWQLQVRRDPFESESAAVFAIYLRAPSESRPQALARIAGAALERDPGDRLARLAASAPETYLANFEAVAGYLLASLEASIIELPAAASGYPAALEAARADRARLRGLCLWVLLLCALTLGLVVVQRGLQAAAIASRVMRTAGEAPAALERQRTRMVLRVLAVVTSVLLAFAAIALYIVVRSRGI